MRDNFKRSLAVTLQWEGGFVNHPADPGGATNNGITLATYRRYKPHATVQDLKNIPQSAVERIYLEGYWNRVGGNTLSAGVDLAAFDYAVNSGPAAALKSLMRSVGGRDYQTVQRLCARRLSIYKTFKHWATFGKGWTRRILAVEAIGVKWASGPDILSSEARRIDKLAREQGATGAGGGILGGGVSLDQLSGAPLLIAFLTLGAVVAVLILKAKRNKDRAKAYEEELKPKRKKVKK